MTHIYFYGEERDHRCSLQAMHLGCLTGNSPFIHLFVVLTTWLHSSLTAWQSSRYKENKPPPGTNYWKVRRLFSRAFQLSGLFSAAQVFSNRIWPPVCVPLSTSLDIKDSWNVERQLSAWATVECVQVDNRSYKQLYWSLLDEFLFFALSCQTAKQTAGATSRHLCVWLMHALQALLLMLEVGGKLMS